ncbi:MAG: FAD-binding oxidoreductase [Bryobacteraceae bacterium]|jgi:glycolate oxidase FAD binding subunit
MFGPESAPVSNGMLHTPETHDDLAEALSRAARHLRTICLQGNSSKRLMAGPVACADETITTAALRRVLEYEPRDLTISVEAGLPWRDLTALLRQNRQMAPLDPPFAAQATVGGVVASNSSGPRRRLYGTARDMVIGMRFVTPARKIVQSGGMVVKNVAGLDMAKLMIGSFGTLAAIVVVNFKLQPMPEVERTILLSFADGKAAFEARARLLTGVLQPAAIDLFNPPAAIHGSPAWILAVRAAGNQASVDRYQRELAAFGESQALEGAPHEEFWRRVEDFTPRFLAAHPDGAVVRVSSTLMDLEKCMAPLAVPAVARAGSGVCYLYFDETGAAARYLADAAGLSLKAVIEFAPEARKSQLELWPAPGADFEIMRRLKALFDPSNVLNRGRLYHRL